MKNDFIPVASPYLSYLKDKDHYLSVISQVLDNGHYILGDQVSSFEQEFSEFMGGGHAIGVASGTDAISLALLSVGVGTGDEVITVSHTAVATAAAIERVGAIPIFIDIECESYCLDPDKLEAAISPRTKAIVPVHIYGKPAGMRRILEIANDHDLKVVEDCAQAHGATINGYKVGTFGHAGAFSCYPTKNLGAFGDAGVIFTKDKNIAESIFCLREYGWKERFVSEVSGWNSRLDEMQASMLRIKLRHLDKNNLRRREIAEQYATSLENCGVTLPSNKNNELHAMHLYVVACDERNQLREFLTTHNIGTAIHYPVPVHKQPAYSSSKFNRFDLPITETLYKCCLTLPMFPELTNEQVDRVCQVLNMWRLKRF